MRILGGMVLGAVLLASAAHAAESKAILPPTCEDYASVAADENLNRDMQRAGVFEKATPGKVLVIAAGNKFFMPRFQAQGTLAPKTVDQNLSDWNLAYDEAYLRCLRSDDLTMEVPKH